MSNEISFVFHLFVGGVVAGAGYTAYRVYAKLNVQYQALLTYSERLEREIQSHRKLLRATETRIVVELSGPSIIRPRTDR